MYPAISTGSRVRERSLEEVESRLRSSWPLSLSLWVLAYRCLDTARGFFAMWPLRVGGVPGVVVNVSILLPTMTLLFPGLRSQSNESRIPSVTHLSVILERLFSTVREDVSCVVGSRHGVNMWCDFRTWAHAMRVLRSEGFRGRSEDPDRLVSTFVTRFPLDAVKLGDPALRRTFISPTQIQMQPFWFPNADRGYSVSTPCFGVPLWEPHLRSWAHFRMQCNITQTERVTHLHSFFDESEAPILTREELSEFTVPVYPEVQQVIRFHHHNASRRILVKKTALLKSIDVDVPCGRMPSSGLKRAVYLLARELEVALVRDAGIRPNKSYGYVVARPVDTVLEVLKERAHPTIASFDDDAI